MTSGSGATNSVAYGANATGLRCRIYNLLTDLKEERDVGAYNTWIADPMFKIIAEFEGSLKKYPPIKMGTPDPYTPPS